MASPVMGQTFSWKTSTGLPASGYLVYTTEPGTGATANPIARASYVDASGLQANTNPVVLSPLGEAVIYVAGATEFRITTPVGTLVYGPQTVTGDAFLVDTDDIYQNSSNVADALEDLTQGIGEGMVVEGAWAASTVYAAGDVVTAPGDAGVKRCTIPHTSGSSFTADDALGRWETHILAANLTTIRLAKFSNNLPKALLACGSATVRLLAEEPYNVTDNATIPVTCTLEALPGAIATISSGKTLTVNGPLVAGAWQIFGGTGSVANGGLVGNVDPAWFGMSTSAADNSISINKAVGFAPVGTRISVRAPGTYTCLTEIAVAKSGVEIALGRRVKLNFTPSGPLTNAVRLFGYDNSLVGGHIVVNSNVTNIVKLQGDGQRANVYRSLLEGPAVIPAGQTAVLIDGTTPAAYFSRIADIDVVNCDIGVHLLNEAGAAFIRGLNTASTNTPIKDASAGGLTTVQGLFAQNPTVAGIDVSSSGNNYTDVQIESDTPGCAAIRFNAGANYNVYWGAHNSGSGALITDNGTGNFGMAEQAFYHDLILAGGAGKSSVRVPDGRVLTYDPAAHLVYFGGVDSATTKVYFRVAGTDFLHVESGGEMETLKGLKVGSAYDSANLARLGNYYLWVDATGALRIKSGVPTSDLDGTKVGAQ